MSRSRRKKPIFAITTSHSECQDKKLWHQRLRARERTILASASLEVLAAHQPVLENEIISVWAMGKDGHEYQCAKTQDAGAEHIAGFKERNPQERASLKRRLLRKWMSK